MESPLNISYPFYLEYSVDNQKRYYFHLSFESVAAAQSAQEFMLNVCKLPTAITSNQVVILPRSSNEFGVDTYEKPNHRYPSIHYIKICSAHDSLFHTFLIKNIAQTDCHFEHLFEHRHMEVYCYLESLKSYIPSWDKRQALLMHPFQYISTLFTKFRLFRLFSEVISFPKDLFRPVFRYLFTHDKNPVNDYFYENSIAPYFKRFLLDQQTTSNEKKNEEFPLFHVTYQVTQETSQNFSFDTHYFSPAKLHLYTTQKDGNTLAKYLSETLELLIETNDDCSHIAILPMQYKSSGHSVGVFVNPITESIQPRDDSICRIDFLNPRYAYEFTQRVSLKDDKGEIPTYNLYYTTLSLRPTNSKICKASNLFEEAPFTKNKIQLSIDLFDVTSLKTALNNLRKILHQNPGTKNSNIYTATLDLERELKTHFSASAPYYEKEYFLNAIRNFERACDIDLGTTVGQAVALLIVAAVGFTLGAVIGEAIGIYYGSWSDIVSATSKIIDEFVNGTVKTITSEALGVLGAALTGAMVAPALTYGIFFKSTETTKAAQKVASEAKSFVENPPRISP